MSCVKLRLFRYKGGQCPVGFLKQYGHSLAVTPVQQPGKYSIYVGSPSKVVMLYSFDPLFQFLGKMYSFHRKSKNVFQPIVLVKITQNVYLWPYVFTFMAFWVSRQCWAYLSAHMCVYTYNQYKSYIRIEQKLYIVNILFCLDEKRAFNGATNIIQCVWPKSLLKSTSQAKSGECIGSIS